MKEYTFREIQYTPIDIEKLRKALLEDCEEGFYGGGIGTDFIRALEIEDADPDELLSYAKEMHVPVSDYYDEDDD